MPLLLRSATLSRWVDIDDEINIEDIDADAITDLRTTKNRLSMWLISDDKKDMDNAILALATNRDGIEKMSVFFVELNEVEKCFSIQNTPGQSPFIDVNSSHRDVCGLTHKGLGKLAGICLNSVKNSNWEEISKNRIKEMIKNAIQEKRLTRDLVKKKLQDNIEKEIGWDL